MPVSPPRFRTTTLAIAAAGLLGACQSATAPAPSAPTQVDRQALMDCFASATAAQMVVSYDTNDRSVNADERMAMVEQFGAEKKRLAVLLGWNEDATDMSDEDRAAVKTKYEERMSILGNNSGPDRLANRQTLIDGATACKSDEP